MKPSNLGRSALLLLAMALPLPAQASRTWVSGVGDDANPCSRTAPCRTFAGAITKTVAMGEINTLDSGGFGAVTITRSITLDGAGTQAGILAGGVSGIVVNTQATDTVILRNLVIKGPGPASGAGLSGIRILSAGTLVVVENCVISGFTVAGIEVAVPASASAGGRLAARDVTINGWAAAGAASTGITVSAPSGYAASLDRLTIAGTGTGLQVLGGTTVLTRSLVSHCAGSGVRTDGGTVSVLHSSLRFNAGPALQSVSGILRAADNDLFDNGAAFAGAGALLSGGDNRTGGNGAGVTPPTGLPVY
jgi:hypothetical protein